MSTIVDAATDRRTFLRGAVGLGGGLAVLATGCARSDGASAKNNATAQTVAATNPAAAPQPTAPQPTPNDGARLPDGLDPAHFHLHNPRPLSLETRRSAFGRGPITPTSRFFVRNNLPMPDRAILDDPDAWTVEFAGVGAPGKLTVAELKRFDTHTLAAVIQCSGNGRKFYKHRPSGSPWATGAAGCALWTGVKVADVIASLGGAAPGLEYMTSTGGEKLPKGVDPLRVVVERSIPAAKGLRDAMLVWEMNGAPLPLTHGGPIRLLVPGFYGCNQVKYVKRVAFTAEQTRAKIQHSGYRLRPIGSKGAPTQPSMWAMNVKSWINGPGADDEPVLAGRVQLYGVALAGERKVATVEVSVDGGASWKEARLVGPDLGPFAWRAFAFDATLAVGKHTICSRATDDAGNTQPEQRIENERGYGHNGWRDAALAVRAVAKLPPRPKTPRAERRRNPSAAAHAGKPLVARDSAQLSDAGKRGKAIVAQHAQPPCGACHTVGDAGLSGTVGPNLDAMRPDIARVQAAVTNGVGAMPPYKGLLTEEQIRQIATYIAEATALK